MRVAAEGKGAKAYIGTLDPGRRSTVATVPSPEPDYGPVDSPPEPTVPPSELPPMPDDVDQPAPINDPQS